MTNKPPELINPTPARSWNPCRVAATVSVTLAAAPATINSVLIGPAADRVLLTAQAAGAQNGIYIPVESGGSTTLNVSAAQSTTITPTAGVLIWVSVTGTITVTGANGSVVEGSPGFLSPLSGPNRLDVTGGTAGGVVTYKQAVALVRSGDADANGDFLAGKTADVSQGANAGIWTLQGPVSSLVITNSLALSFLRTYEAAQAPLNPFATLTTVAPSIKPLGFVFAVATSLGALSSNLGTVNGLI